MTLSILAPAPIHWDIPPLAFWAMWCGFAAFIALILYAKSREVRQRRAALAQAAMEMGFMFVDKPDDLLAAELAPIHVAGAQLGTNPRFRNVLQGTAAGMEAIIADRTVGGGKNQSTSTVVAFKFATPFPTFFLCPENLLWRLAEKIGYSDIDIENAQEFSRRYFLHGDDPAAVRALFRPEIVQAFERIDPKEHFYVSGSANWLVAYRPGKTLPPEQVRGFLQQAETVAAAFRGAQTRSMFR